MTGVFAGVGGGTVVTGLDRSIRGYKSGSGLNVVAGGAEARGSSRCGRSIRFGSAVGFSGRLS